MGWSSEEEKTTKRGMETSSKILLAIIACLVLIILLIIVLLLNIQGSSFAITVDGKSAATNSETLLAKVGNVTYINIEEFAKLVKYEYHKGEYKAFTIEEDKCYVQGTNETSTFFLNDNKIYKLPVNELTQDYREFEVENTIREINGKMYAPIDAINVAFNVVVDEKSQSLEIYTLDYLVSLYDENIKKWGYSSIAEQDFENKKSLLYGYLIVKKEGGLYKIIDNNNSKEIVSDKYTSIEFVENTQEFFVTNSLGQVGIINLDGTTKIEPIYEAISILDKDSDLYLVQKDKKYGVVKSKKGTVIYPEYDSIGIDTKNLTINLDSKYLILDTLIPVCKENKWGAFDKDGNLVYNVEYDGFGSSLTTVEINGVKKTVNPVLSIEECNGVIVKKNEKYGIIDLEGKSLVSISVDAIYTNENEAEEYYMLYKNNEMNVLDELVKAGLIEERKEETNTNTQNNNTVTNNAVTNNLNGVANQVANGVSNNVVQ